MKGSAEAMENPNESSIRHQSSNRIDTFRDDGSSNGEAPVTKAAVSAAEPFPVGPNDGTSRSPRRQYRAAVTTNATSVLAAIDMHRPGMSTTKKHLLLFFAQGHHLADLGDVLFTEAIYTTDRDIAVDLTDDDPDLLSDAEFNTVVYVLHRYGNLSPADLRTLIQASAPWQMGRNADRVIERLWLRDWFLRADEQNDADDDRPTAAMAAAKLR